MSKPITFVDAGGQPVTEVSTGGVPVAGVDVGGQPVTLVSVGGQPVVIVSGSPDAGFDPASLFANGEEGALLLPGPTTSFLSSTDLTPCGAGDTVGFQLDTSKGAGYDGADFTGLGSELVTNGTFDTDTDWTDISTGTGSATISGGIATLSATNSANRGQLIQGFTTVLGKSYVAEVEAQGIGGVNQFILYAQTSPVFNTGVLESVSEISTSLTTLRIVFTATTTTTYISVRAGSSSIATFDNISVRELPGHHATQATAASRPTLARVPSGGRRNLLNQSEDFVPATSDWSYNASGITVTEKQHPQRRFLSSVCLASGHIGAS